MNLFKALSTAVALVLSLQARAGEEGMTHMPKVAPAKSYTVQTKESGEDLLDQRGFGHKEPMVRMMNLMMVGGSGYEGMDMAQASGKTEGSTMMHKGHMQMAANEDGHKATTPSEGFNFDIQINPNPPKVGANTVSISIVDSKTGALRKGLKVKAQVYMTSMDMGTDEPRVREVSPGKYQLKATFSMKGPWAVKLGLPGQEKVFNVDVGSSK